MKRWKYFVAFVVILGATLCSAWYYQFYPFSKIPYLPIPVHFTRSNIPYTEIEIQRKKCFMLIDLGSVSECWLRKELLDDISKQFVKNAYTMNLKGEVHETHEYKIPRVKIENAWIKDVLIREESYNSSPSSSSFWSLSEKSYQKDGTPIDGRIGWEFLTSFYPFFDLGSSIFYFTRGQSTLPKLEKIGYSISKLHPTSFEINYIGCVFTVDTSIGKKKLLFDTGCTRSIIKSSIINPKDVIVLGAEKKATTLGNILIGEYLIGEMEFLLFDFDEKFDDIDGVLGMDFFSRNIIYLDFKEKKALIGPSQFKTL